MNRIVILGAGNVAHHLFKAFSTAEGFKVIQVYNHKPASLETFRSQVSITANLEEIKPAELYVLAIKDDAIEEIAAQLKNRDALVVHTSGSVGMDVLQKFERRGVFYPLQTFSKNKAVDLKSVPFCIEANNDEDVVILEALARNISEKVFKINSEQRASLHVAAVFVSNFVNYLYTEGEAICREKQVPFEILHPLIIETAEKVTKMKPFEAQTGPGKRNDKKVIQFHLAQLKEEQKKLYSFLTQSIQTLHGKEL